MEVNRKTQSNGMNCRLHVVRAGSIRAKLSANVEKATIEGNRIGTTWQVLSSACAEDVQCWKLLVIIASINDRARTEIVELNVHIKVMHIAKP